MRLFPKGFRKGLIVGGVLAAIWWVFSDRRRRESLIDGVMERTEAIPFPGTRMYGLLAEQLMGGIYRAVAQDVLSEAESGVLLEIGGGPGHLALELGRRARNLQITMMDLSGDMVQMAESRIHNAGLGQQVKVVLGDAKDVPFPDSSFDYVLSLGSLHHWKAPDLVLNEIYRVLKPGGKAWIYDIRREMSEGDLELVRQKVPSLLRPFFELGMVGSWRASFTEGQIRDLVSSSPFSQAEIRPLVVAIMGVNVPGLTKILLQKGG